MLTLPALATHVGVEIALGVATRSQEGQLLDNELARERKETRVAGSPD